MTPTRLLLAMALLSACTASPDDDDTSGSDTLPPVVAITTPAAGLTVSGTVPVHVEASDDVGVSSVSLSVDGSQVGTTSATPYDFTWDSTAELNGNHVLEAMARDADGNASSTSVTVSVDNGGLPANAVNLTNPVDASTVCGTITVTASALPAIVQVAFSVDFLPIGTDDTAPFTATWDTAAFAEGPHVVTAIGSDIEGNEAQASASVDVANSGAACDNLPTVAITSPADGAAVNGTLTVTANASDDSGVRRVEFFLDGGMFVNDEAIPYSAELDTTLFNEGPHGLRAVAYDTGEQTAQHDITINIDRTPPELAFVSPPSSSSVYDSFDVTVTATDNVVVAEVELWVGGNSAGSLGASPYTWSVDSTQLASGPLTLEATATDGVGLQATASRSLDVDQLPEINITSPGGSVSAATETISASASDDLGIDHVDFRVDGALIDTDWGAPWEASWSTCDLGGGTRTLEVTCEDSGGQTVTDSTTVTVALQDSDGDGVTVCDDCDDGDAAVYPGASELCDGLVSNCGVALPADELDADGDGQMTCAGDCNDGDDSVYLGAPELCDGVDNDCVGGADFPGGEVDGDGDGSLSCADCDDADPLRSPDFEESLSSNTCSDGIDNNCDNEADGPIECAVCPTAQGIDFVEVGAGAFEMGCTAGAANWWRTCGSDEFPVHTVTLSRSFCIGETELTQGQWQSLMGNNPSNATACSMSCPVEMLNWWEALAYANELSDAEGLSPCYDLVGCSSDAPGMGMTCSSANVTNSTDGTVYGCDGYRLPTEAEWEYSARAGTDFVFSGADSPEPVAWYVDNNNGYTPGEVGTRDPNGWGLYDMSGNVGEWVQDWYDAGYYSASPAMDPLGPSTGSSRSPRGGSWVGYASAAGVAERSYPRPPEMGSFSIGVRLVRTIP